MSELWAITRKDLVVEFRKKGVINSVLLFSVLVLLVMYFAIEHDRRTLDLFGPPAFWISLLFSSFLSFNHLMRVERDNECLSALICSPVPAWRVYLGKSLSIFCLLTIMELVLTPILFLLFGYGLSVEVVPFVLVVLLGNVGISVLGTIFSSLLIMGRASEFLLPVLMLPFLFPLLIAGVQASFPLLTATAGTTPFAGSPLTRAATWIIFLLAMDLMFVSAGTLLSTALYKP